MWTCLESRLTLAGRGAWSAWCAQWTQTNLRLWSAKTSTILQVRMCEEHVNISGRGFLGLSQICISAHEVSVPSAVSSDDMECGDMTYHHHLKTRSDLAFVRCFILGRAEQANNRAFLHASTHHWSDCPCPPCRLIPTKWQSCGVLHLVRWCILHTSVLTASPDAGLKGNCHSVGVHCDGSGSNCLGVVKEWVTIKGCADAVGIDGTGCLERGPRLSSSFAWPIQRSQQVLWESSNCWWNGDQFWESVLSQFLSSIPGTKRVRTRRMPVIPFIAKSSFERKEWRIDAKRVRTDHWEWRHTVGSRLVQHDYASLCSHGASLACVIHVGCTMFVEV